MIRSNQARVAVSVDRSWENATLSVADRVEALMRRMTLAEKVGQLGSRWVGVAPVELGAHEDSDAAESRDPIVNVAPMQDVFALGGKASLEEASRDGLGHLTRVYGSAPVTPAQGAAELVRQQHVVLDASRLGIPALVHEECLTGFTTYGATVYPAAIAWAATFDPALVEQMAAAIGRDMAALGVHQGLSPVVDVVRDYRWGRVEETMGEDPYLVTMLGAAYVRGLQSAGVLATVKHFAGYSASRAARNHGPVSMGRRELLDVVLPPFETADRRGGRRIGDELVCRCRRRPGRCGSLAADRGAARSMGLHRNGGVRLLGRAVPRDDAPHSGRRRPRLDCMRWRPASTSNCPTRIGYGEGLVDAVTRGDIPEALVDRAARRLLTQKAELGLLDADWTPEASVRDAAGIDLDSPANRAIARQLAERSIILLDAGAVLPLLGADRPQLARVAVVGPCAADPQTFLGCYSFPNHVLPLLRRDRSRHRDPQRGRRVAQRNCPTSRSCTSRAARSPARPFRVRGRGRRGPRRGPVHRSSSATAPDCSGTERPARVAMWRTSGCRACRPTSSTRCSMPVRRSSSWSSPAVPMRSATSPAAPPDWSRRSCRARKAARQSPGVLSGRISPGGKLPVQIPRRPGGQPRTYLQPPLGSAESAGISSLDTTPLFPFGYGASYTSFEIDDLRFSATEVPTDGEFEVVGPCPQHRLPRRATRSCSCTCTTSSRELARPVKQLAGFARRDPRAGRCRRCPFPRARRPHRLHQPRPHTDRGTRET